MWQSKVRRITQFAIRKPVSSDTVISIPKELLCLRQEQGLTFDLSNGILIHCGGWKQLTSEAVSEEEFHNRLLYVFGLSSIHDYYGIVEQIGCIYVECEEHHLHASIFSYVITRMPLDFSEADSGEAEILQVVSTILEYYPSTVLTEDEGIILGIDDCPCGRR